MTVESLTALAVFAVVSTITPGPNNLMLMSSGANFGLRRTLPHMLGVGLGHATMVVLVGLGLVGVFEAWPASHTVLKAASVAYLLWLAWKIAHAAAPEGERSAGSPLSFLQAAAFQWVNPKAWTIALTAFSAYAPGQTLAAVAAVGLVFLAASVPSTTLWTVIGTRIRLWLTTRRRLVAFNRTMALLLVASLVPVLAG